MFLPMRAAKEGRTIASTAGSRALSSFARAALLFVFLLAVGLSSAAQAADMRHRLSEHVIEGYVLTALGASVTERGGEMVAGQLQTQIGLGVVFPTMRLLGVWGVEAVIGPAFPLNDPSSYTTQLAPGVIFELPMSNLQLFGRASALIPIDGSGDVGASLAFMVGWHSRPSSWRGGVAYDIDADGRVFTGFRLEMAWLGHDPRP